MIAGRAAEDAALALIVRQVGDDIDAAAHLEAVGGV